MRVLNGVALVLVAASVLAQCLGFALRYSGDGSGIAGSALGLIGLTIVPGMVLALAKLVLNLLRWFRGGRVGPRAAMYGAVVALPFVFALILAAASSRANAPLLEAHGLEVIESEQYLAGSEWAKAHRPVHNTECKGSHEFQRGCWNTIDLRRKAQRDEGYEWAGKHLPEKAALCQGSAYFVLGCRTYFAERLKKPALEGVAKYEGMTTAECREAVNARFEAAKAIDLEHENFRSIDSTAQRHWIPELADCENYDKLATSKVVPSAYARLAGALDKLREGQQLGDDEKSGMLKDFTMVSTVPRDLRTEAYMQLFDEYVRYLNGEVQRPDIVYPKLTCPEFQARIEQLRQLDKDRSDAMAALRRPGGVITDGAAHATLNQQRIDMLWEWKLHTQGAAKAGCAIDVR